MPHATELTHVSPRCVIWQVYDPGVKAELFSTALRLESGVFVVDPIALRDGARQQLAALGQIETVLITNANHERAAGEFAPEEAIFIPPELRDVFPKAQLLSEDLSLCELTTVRIDGAAPGEFAFHDPAEGGTLIIGDALINFDPHGFALLPAKYCADRKQMIRSLRRLLDLEFTRIFLAHGPPIVTRARARLATLLNESS